MVERHPTTSRQHRCLRRGGRTSVPPAVRVWVQRVSGEAVVRVRRLDGASSTAVHLLRLAAGTSLVLRRYAWRGHLDAEPDAPELEVAALGFALRQRVAHPRGRRR